MISLNVSPFAKKKSVWIGMVKYQLLRNVEAMRRETLSIRHIFIKHKDKDCYPDYSYWPIFFSAVCIVVIITDSWLSSSVVNFIFESQTTFLRVGF